MIDLTMFPHRISFDETKVTELKPKPSDIPSRYEFWNKDSSPYRVATIDILKGNTELSEDLDEVISPGVHTVPEPIDLGNGWLRWDVEQGGIMIKIWTHKLDDEHVCRVVARFDEENDPLEYKIENMVINIPFDD